jgi:AcrR family transcriptional regulator
MNIVSPNDDDEDAPPGVPLPKTTAPDERKARERILEAAEALFAEFGFDGVSLRQIATRSEVPVGLVSYHFTTKLGVYRAVFELRTPVVVEQRKAGLALAVMEENPERRLEMIIKAMLLPMLNLRVAEHSNHFGVLLAREVNDPRSIERGIIQEMVDPIAMVVIEHFKALLPDRTTAEIHWAYQVMVGAMTFAMSDTGRISRLSNGAADPTDVATTMRHLLDIMMHGLRGAPSGAPGSGAQ